MKGLTMLIMAAVLAVTLAGPAEAGVRAPRVDRREARQHLRIRQGVCSGRLTAREARALRRGQRHIRRLEWRAQSDGKVTLRERRRLHRALDRQSCRIYRLKHNARVR
jgi:hypothetical protein